MLPVIALGAGMAAASMYSSSQTNAANERMANAASDFNREEAQKNRDFQQVMSNTAYQRTVHDMRKAGINPMLAINQGGASTPAGGTATASAPIPKQDVLGKGMQAGVSSAIEATRIQNELTNSESQRGLNASTIKTQGSQQSVNNANSAKTIAETNQLPLKNELIKTQTQSLKNNLEADLAEAKLRKATAEKDAEWVDYDRGVKTVQPFINSAATAAQALGKARGMPMPQPRNQGPKTIYNTHYHKEKP